MYQGYRLKIDGVILPNNWIAKGSYNATNEKRVVEVWKDANLVEHQITTGTTKAEISFSLIQHDSSKHAEMMAPFQNDDGMIVEFYDDRTDSYREAHFRIQDIKFNHMNTYGGMLQYSETAITLVEN